MTADDLRTRIAQAIFKRFECPHGDLADISDEWESWWLRGSDEDRKPFYDQADAVIRELNLTQEWSIGDDDGGRVIWDDRQEAIDYTWRKDQPVQTRHVTEWTADE